MTRAFCVAGHIFQLILSQDGSYEDALRPYLPFETEPSSDAIFTLRITDSLPESVDEVLYDQEPEPGQSRIRLCKSGDSWLIEMAVLPDTPVCGKVLSDKDFTEASLMFCGKDPSDRAFAINNALMLLYAFRTASMMTLEMHASVICNGGKGYLFLGKSGTGKSTHSRLWLKHIPGSSLMNDDNPIIRIGQDGQAIVYGSPWSGKTPCYRNVSAPIGGIVRIRQEKFNKIERMGIVEAYASVYSSCSGFKADREMADGLHATLEQIAINVPCYTLDCLPDEEAARICAAETAGIH